MARPSFQELLATAHQAKRFVCVGLDSAIKSIPSHVWNKPVGADGAVFDRILTFNQGIVEVTAQLAAAFKLNYAFYARAGIDGIRALIATVEHIKKVAPNVLIIVDAKRADVGHTNEEYAAEVFDVFGADATTVSPYFGRKSLSPFLSRKGRGTFVLCRTSGEGDDEFQDLPTGIVNSKPLYLVVAEHVEKSWNGNNNCGLVVGATTPNEIAEVRKVATLPLLIPGFGKQAGEVEASVKNAAGDGSGMFVANSSRSIIFASAGKDWKEAAGVAAEQFHNQILAALAA